MSQAVGSYQFGLPPAKAASQLIKDQLSASQHAAFQPLPSPTGTEPYRKILSTIVEEPADGVAFHVIGDHGGVKDPWPQKAVAEALIANHAKLPVSFCYSVGDVVYFNGAEAEYPPQFGEPYAHYNVPVFAIPGNHDGDPGSEALGEGEYSGEPSLQGFVKHFCDTEPRLLADMEEFGRTTMTQPNCYWTLCSSHFINIGLYSNVPSGGDIREPQLDWFKKELVEAPKDRPLIVSLHHPPFSVDAHHGGSARMNTLLDQAFQETDTYPSLILTGHVHDYQRFTRQFNGHKITYVVIGNSGYHNLHALAKDAQAGTELVSGVTFEYGDAHHWGFLRFSISQGEIAGAYTQVDRQGAAEQADTFTV